VCRDSVVSAYKVVEGLGDVGSTKGDVDAELLVLSVEFLDN
jgi:hypothetical protein